MAPTFIITISGLDGSGKTLNAEKLVRRLRRLGVNCRYLWTGWKPSVSYPFLALMRLTGFTKRVRMNGKVFVAREYYLKPLRIIWPVLLLLDYFVHSVTRVKLTQWLRQSVVCDRYVYDLLAQLLDEDLCHPLMRKLALKTFGLPSISLLLDVRENTSWERTVNGERTLEQPLYDIARRRRTYLKLAQHYGMIVIDGERDPGEVNEEVTSAVLSQLSRIVPHLVSKG